MNRVIVVYFIFYLICLTNVNGSTSFQKNEVPVFSSKPSKLVQSKLVQSKLVQPGILAQSRDNSDQDGFEEPGEYAVFPRSTRPSRRFGFRVFGGLNFAWNIKSRYSQFNRPAFDAESSEYIFPHTSLLGSLSFGGSFFFLITKEIGAIFSASYEIESKVEQYKYKQFNDSRSPNERGVCPISSKDQDYFLCSLEDQFSYSIISLELSTFYKVLPAIYLFAGPNFFIPVGFKVLPNPRNIRGGQIPFEIKGHIGGQAGIGFVYQKFFVESLFKTQNFILEGIRLNNTGTIGAFETGRLWGFMIRGGLQF